MDYFSLLVCTKNNHRSLSGDSKENGKMIGYSCLLHLTRTQWTGQ